MDANTLWQSSLPDIEEAIKSSVFMNTYLKNSYPISFENDVFTLHVEMEISKNMIECRHHKTIEDCISRNAGHKIVLVVTTQKSSIKKEEPIQENEINKEPQKRYINPRYTFDNFVVGPSNEYATSASLSVVNNPGNINPLFLYGNSGLGKTHLMIAIGNMILDQKPETNVVYVTSEKFTSDFVNLVGKEKNGKAFRDLYRKADVLLIDDIQFLTGKEGVQEEFFHTFEDLHQEGKQIVITCDRRPTELKTLNARLTTRFSAGLIIDISAPSYETRVGIIEKKLESFNFHLNEDIIDYIANHIKTNVRDIEGAINRLIYDKQLSQGGEITLESAMISLKSVLPDSKVITPQLIIKKVCEYYNIREDELLGSNRSQNFAVPRQIAMYLSLDLTMMNYVQLSTIFSKDRTTIMSNVKKIEDKMIENESLRFDINHLKEEISSF